jgi:general secretion pathway protein L
MMNARLVLLSPSSEQPSSYLIVDRSGVLVDRGTLATRGTSPPFKGRTILVVPGTDVVTRWLELDDGPQARIAEAAAVMLKDQIGAPRDDVHIAVGEREDDGKRAVSVVDRALMQELLDRADDLGVSPDIVIPDHLMLLPPDDGVLTVTVNGVVAVRGQHLAFSAEAELASLLIGARERRSIEPMPEVERMFAAASVRSSLNLLQQDFAAGGQGSAKWGGYRRVAALAALAALSPFAIWTAEIVRNEASARSLEARAQAAARTIVGDAGSADPIRELRGRIAELRGNDAFMQTTAALFEAISRTSGVELESLSYLRDGVMRATLIHAASSDVGTLRAALEQSAVALDEDASEERDGRMVTTVTLSTRS